MFGVVVHVVKRGKKCMPKWLRKTFIVLITVFTFGLVSPPDYLYIDDVKADKPEKQSYIEDVAIPYSEETSYSYSPPLSKEDFVTNALAEAESQSFQKFGTKISPVIEEEFREAILPKIEEALTEVSEQADEGELSNLGITESPSGGYGEKIFNVYNRETGEDVIRFHVRRDHPPKDGYWFNFHYHTSEDGFQKHYDLGKIYWNQNMPPKWLN
jgi:YpjP-like protein